MFTQKFKLLLKFALLSSLILVLGLFGCSSRSKRDAAPHHPPKNLDRVPDAVPKVEPLSKYGNRFKNSNTYVTKRKRYSVMSSSKGYRARGLASWYGTKFHGRRTSSGEPYNMYAMTAAHRTLPLPTYAKVTNLDNGKSVIVKVNDRGPFHKNRIIDLSYVAAHKLGMLGRGTGNVQVESVDPRDHRGFVHKKRTLFSRSTRRTRTLSPTPLPTSAPTPGPQGTVLASNKLPSSKKPVAPLLYEPRTSRSAEKPKIYEKTNGRANEKVNEKINEKSKFYLQVGTFDQKANAVALASQLVKTSKIPTHVTELHEKKGSRFRVRVGPIADKTEALALSQKLARSNASLQNTVVISE